MAIEKLVDAVQIYFTLVGLSHKAWPSEARGCECETPSMEQTQCNNADQEIFAC